MPGPDCYIIQSLGGQVNGEHRVWVCADPHSFIWVDSQFLPTPSERQCVIEITRSATTRTVHVHGGTMHMHYLSKSIIIE